MPAITLANLVLYALHVAVLAALGVLLSRLVGAAAPRARLLHYRVVLVVALGLPLASPVVQPVAPASPAWRHARGAAAGGPAPAAAATEGSVATWPLATSLARAAGPVAFGGLVMGFAARLTWVGAGLWRLRRLRRRATRLEPRPIPVAEAVTLAAADADIRLSPEIACPVNFGARRPAVLLPPSLQTYADEQQRAIVCHELIHVRRHDWLRTVGDEVVRAALWFHPAVWWLLEEIHLAREQVVDQEVVEITGARRPYLEALVRLAHSTADPRLWPAASLLGRAHLPRRVAMLLKEVRMSQTRLTAGLLASASLLLASSALVVRALPLQAAAVDVHLAGRTSASDVTLAGAARAAQEPRTEAATRVPRQTARLLSRVKPVYPLEARQKAVQGTVILKARVDTSGRVKDVQVLRSVALLDQAAIDAVRQWRFAPQAAESDYVASIAFDLADPTLWPQPKVLSRVEPVYPPDAKARGVKGSVIVQARIDTNGRVTEVKVLRSIALLDQAAIDAVRQWRFEPPATESVATCVVRFDPDRKR